MQDNFELGRQHNGGSGWYIKKMALAAKQLALGNAIIPTSADIGGGSGEFARILKTSSHRTYLLDYYSSEACPPEVEFLKTELNQTWPLPDSSINFAFALEVIEHIENPRQFFREFTRILCPGGHGFVSTPNNHSLTSKFTFLIKGEHRLFQDLCYPAHITALLQCDFLRMAHENHLTAVKWFYSNHDTIPRLHWKIRMPGRAFSSSMGLLFQKGA